MIGSQSNLNDLENIDKKATEALSTAQSALSSTKVETGLYHKQFLTEAADANSLINAGSAYFDRNGQPECKNMPIPSISAYAGLAFGQKDRLAQIVIPWNSDVVFCRRMQSGSFGSWFELLTNKNTIVDANGFVKKS